jgi:transcriptional regulator with XRE-family HTH domain
MTDRTLTWKERQDRLGIPVATIAKATGVSARSVQAYRSGSRNPSALWLTKVDWLLTDFERAVERGAA